MEAAFFDLDKTVIAKASIAAFGRTFYRGGLISRSTILRALASQLVYLHLGASEQKLAQVRESVLELTKGWDQKEVSRLVREALDDIVEPIIYRRGPRPDRASPGGGQARLPRVRLARRDRPATRRVPRGPRFDSEHGGRGRRRPLHRRDGVLRLRSVQGRCDA